MSETVTMTATEYLNLPVYDPEDDFPFDEYFVTPYMLGMREGLKTGNEAYAGIRRSNSARITVVIVTINNKLDDRVLI